MTNEYATRLRLGFLEHFVKILRETLIVPKFVFDLERIAEIEFDLVDWLVT